jgi:hypothetical protein
MIMSNTTQERAGRGVHLVGSVPLESSEEVFATVSALLGPYVRRIPDGETGERTGWIGFQVPMLAAHPALEPESDVRESDVRDEELFERAGRGEGEEYRLPTFRLRAGVDPRTVTFDRLGYAAAALASYAEFARLKAGGVIAAGTRFQVCLPTPLAPLVVFLAPRDVAALLPAYQQAMLRELAEIVDRVPPGELAVQWDVANEIALLEHVFPAPFDDVSAAVATELVSLGNSVPVGVELGYHFCYGDVPQPQRRYRHDP